MVLLGEVIWVCLLGVGSIIGVVLVTAVLALPFSTNIPGRWRVASAVFTLTFLGGALYEYLSSRPG